MHEAYVERKRQVNKENAVKSKILRIGNLVVEPETLPSAFPKTAADLAGMLDGAEFDGPAFERKIKPCDLARCCGTCCHDGAYLSGEEASVIRDLVKERRDDLQAIGLDLPDKVVVFGSWRGVASGPKTATRPAPMRKMAEDYPEHFEETNCVFLLEDARCGLQVLAERDGLPKWYFKPFTCWMHPISLTAGENGRTKITLYSEETDPQRYPDYDGFVCRTHCGRSEDDGLAAKEVLKEELETLALLAKSFGSGQNQGRG